MASVIQEELARLATCNNVVKNPMKEEREKLFSLFPQVVTDLTQEIDHPVLQDLTKWYTDVLQYNIVGGKMTRALTFVMACTHLMEGSLNEAKLQLIYSIGWCIELLQAAVLVADDIMDRSETRRGKLCWYKQSHVGVMAVNDAFLLDSGVYCLLRKYHEKQPYYTNILDVLHKVHFYTNLGQTLDSLSCSTKATPRLHMFNDERLEMICKYKTTYYTFLLPVSLAMYVAGITDEKLHSQVDKVFERAGVLYEAENDFLDCYGDEVMTGKAGTDIQEGKCTWFVVTALKLANKEQRKILEECFGSSDPDDVIRVKNLYNQLNLPRRFLKYAEDLRSSLFEDICSLPSEMFRSLCKRVMDEAYIRNTSYVKKIIEEQFPV